MPHITLCQKTKCNACRKDNAIKFYIGVVPYRLCMDCIEIIVKNANELKLMIAYENLDIDYRKL